MENNSKSLNDFINQPLKVKGVKKIIIVASAKGGVGKSTIACNLAIALQMTGSNTALVDADIYGPSIVNLMNLKGRPEIEDGLLLPIISNYIKCISIGSIVDADSAGIWRGPMITKILHQLIRNVNWQYDNKEVDIMIIDMPPGTGDVYLSIAEKFPVSSVVLVSTPQTLAVIDTIKSVDCFKKLNIPIKGIIQNMSYLEVMGEKKFLFGCDGAKKLAELYKLDFLGEIPIIPEISQSIEESIPYLIKYPNSQLALFLKDLVKNWSKN